MTFGTKNIKEKTMVFGTTLVLIFLMFSPVINAELTRTIIEDTTKNDDDSVYDLLIITPKAFVKNLQPFVRHKDHFGVKTYVATLNIVYEKMFWEGRDEAEKIKYFIKNAIENWGINYVLLVGGIKNQFSRDEQWWLPVRYSHLVDRWAAMPRYKENKFISDLYFADIYDSSGDFCSWDSDGDGIFGEWFDDKPAQDVLDLHPDVYLGRLPCRNRFEVKIMVNKIINYESQPCNYTWFRNMVVVAGDTYIGDDDFEGEIETQMALDQMPDFNQIRLWTSLNTFTGPRDVIRAINHGCGFLYLECHGAPSCMGTHPPNETSWIWGLKNAYIPILTNRRKLPVCILGGCHNNMFNVSLGHTSENAGMPCFESIGWRLTRKIGGGSIATIGNTGLAVITEDKLDPSVGGGNGDLNMHFFKEYGQNSTNIIGKAWGKAIHNYLQDHPIFWGEKSCNDTTIDAKTVEQWVLIGDPTLMIGGYS
jgi:hypothetical protein